MIELDWGVEALLKASMFTIRPPIAVVSYFCSCQGAFVRGLMFLGLLSWGGGGGGGGGLLSCSHKYPYSPPIGLSLALPLSLWQINKKNISVFN